METPNNRLDPRIRYLRDPMFHALVDSLRAQIQSAAYTPTELREAVILAATIEEERNFRQQYVVRTDPANGNP